MNCQTVPVYTDQEMKSLWKKYDTYNFVQHVFGYATLVCSLMFIILLFNSIGLSLWGAIVTIELVFLAVLFAMLWFRYGDKEKEAFRVYYDYKLKLLNQKRRLSTE
ncbi:TPA: hypothetical protein DF272_04075 [Candidatus Falkowbacteria bacterium]|nr:hypothetical protein [Candidatus Falkowbacteria bacterium]